MIYRRFEGWLPDGTIATVPEGPESPVADSEVSENAGKYQGSVVERSSNRAP